MGWNPKEGSWWVESCNLFWMAPIPSSVVTTLQSFPCKFDLNFTHFAPLSPAVLILFLFSLFPNGPFPQKQNILPINVGMISSLWIWKLSLRFLLIILFLTNVHSFDVYNKENWKLIREKGFFGWTTITLTIFDYHFQQVQKLFWLCFPKRIYYFPSLSILNVIRFAPGKFHSFFDFSHSIGKQFSSSTALFCQVLLSPLKLREWLVCKAHITGTPSTHVESIAFLWYVR